MLPDLNWTYLPFFCTPIMKFPISAGKEVAQGGRTLAMLSARLWLATKPLLSLPRIGWVNDESESPLGVTKLGIPKPILNILN